MGPFFLRSYAKNVRAPRDSTDTSMSEHEGEKLPVRLEHRPAGPSKGWLVLLSLVSTLALIGVLELVARRLDAGTLGFHFNGKEFVPPIEFLPDLTTNSHGFHDVEWPPPDDDATRVVLLGDSYVAGYWVRTTGTVGQRLQTHLTSESGRRHVVYSIGKSGWGQRHALPALRQHGEALDPDLVVYLVLTFNDIRNNDPDLNGRGIRQMLKESPGVVRVRAADAPGLLFPGSVLNQLVSHRIALLTWRKPTEVPLDYRVYDKNPDAAWTRAWEATFRLLDEINEETERLGARFILVSASTPHGVWGAKEGRRQLENAFPALVGQDIDLDLPDRRLAEYARSRGIDFLALEPIFRDKSQGRRGAFHWEIDGHWNGKGNDLAAKTIAEHLLAAR